MSEQPAKSKKPISTALMLSIIALALATTSFIASYQNTNNAELTEKIDQLQQNMTQFSNFTKNQGTFNIQVINWATQTEQKINLLVNQTLQEER